MLVSRTQLTQYGINESHYFATRTGSTSTCRDMYFIENPTELYAGLYCAIGDDDNGWELEQYNGVNWSSVEVDESYSLIITTNGLAAISNVTRGGLELYFSGIKILSSVVANPTVPIINWTDTDFLQAGEVRFSVGTDGSPNQYDENGNSALGSVLSWRFNTSAGGLQYILTLPAEGIGSTADNGDETWSMGTIGLYVKDPDDNTTDVLFGVATLPELVTKYASNIDRVGNAVKLYFNAICNNLGIVSNLEILAEGEQSIPEVSNETLLLYPTVPQQNMYNCYLVDNLYGTGLPALAVPRALDTTTGTNYDWSFIQPNENSIQLLSTDFADEVDNYMFVYYNSETNLYELAEGREGGTTTGTNEKAPMGVRIGNSVVYSGEVTNASTSYQYSVSISSNGENYAVGDMLLLPSNDGVTFSITVTELNASGGVTAFATNGPTVGNVEIVGSPVTIAAQYDPYSATTQRSGTDARFIVTCTSQSAYHWDFPSDWLNTPLYCDYSTSGENNQPNAGRPTNVQTDAFLGWCTGTNSISLSLDIRNEASTTTYGITRYATDEEVRESLTYTTSGMQTCVTPTNLSANFLQSSLPTNTSQAGSSLSNPVNVQSYVRFDKVILGRGTSAPYESTSVNPNVTDTDISFYGTAYRANWADLAEFYEADKFYEAGTLITMGKGLKEISIATSECNGIVSTKPGYQLGEKKSDLHLPVALVGRVPVKMDGCCMPRFGDKIYLSKVKPGCASTVENGLCLGKIIEKNFGTAQRVECAVRISF